MGGLLNWQGRESEAVGFQDMVLMRVKMWSDFCLGAPPVAMQERGGRGRARSPGPTQVGGRHSDLSKEGCGMVQIFPER